MNKYHIGQKYWLKIFLEPEEMEYLGEINTQKLNGNSIDIKFDVFRRFSYGRPDLIACYNDKFFVRSYDNTVEGLTKAVGDNFRFKGKGYKNISVGKIELPIEEFKEQVKDLLSIKEIEDSILNGGFSEIRNSKGEIKWCPDCKVIRQTSCSACGCGSCEKCDYRWLCYPPNMDFIIKLNENQKIKSD